MAILAITSLLTGSSTPLLASGDVLVFVDVSDTTQSANGSTVKATVTQFFAAIPVPVIVTSASANAFAVGLTGATNAAFQVDASTASQAAGLKVTGAVAAGTVAVVVISSGSNANLSVNAKGSGTIAIGSVSTGAVTITPATTITGALTTSSTINGQTISGTAAFTGTLAVAGVATFTVQPILSSLTASQAVFTDASKGLVSNAITGTGNVVMSASPTLTGTVTIATLVVSGTTNLQNDANVIGALGVTDTLGVAGNFSVNTSKFTVAASSGNTVVAGTLAVTGVSTFTGVANISAAGLDVASGDLKIVNASTAGTVTGGIAGYLNTFFGGAQRRIAYYNP